MAKAELIHADCVEAMAAMDESSVDAIVTDPPYGLEFMGKEWDRLETYAGGNPNMKAHDRSMPKAGPLGGVSYGAPKKMPRCRTCGKLRMGNGSCRCPVPDFSYRFDESGFQMQAWHERWAVQALRVLKPGGHLVAFGGSRTIHRLICALEDAGFEIRDMLCWIYGSGFPKSLNVSGAVEALLPADARCACGRHSSGTVQGSPAGYPLGRDSDGGQPPAVPSNGQAQFPSPADAPERSRGDLRTDGLDAEQARSRHAERSGHPSSEDSLVPSALLQADSLSAGSTQSDMASNTSPDGSTAERRTASRTPGTSRSDDGSRSSHKHIPRCEACGGWYVEAGFGTALKPAWEGITLARKSLSGTVAANVLAYGTGALNVDGTRIEFDGEPPSGSGDRRGGDIYAQDEWTRTKMQNGGNVTPASGRWPANVLLDETAAAMLDEQTGELHSQEPLSRRGSRAVGMFGQREPGANYADAGGASRFFYTAKAPREERNRGVAEYMPDGEPEQVYGPGTLPGSLSKPMRNNHPTVKPVALMTWLCRLVTPPGGTVLDPFAGSGSTGVAALREGFEFIGIERDAGYIEIAAARIQGDAPLFNEVVREA